MCCIFIKNIAVKSSLWLKEFGDINHNIEYGNVLGKLRDGFDFELHPRRNWRLISLLGIVLFQLSWTSPTMMDTGIFLKYSLIICVSKTLSGFQTKVYVFNAAAM